MSNIRTLRLEIFPVADTKEEKVKIYRSLDNLLRQSFRAANEMVNTLVWIDTTKEQVQAVMQHESKAFDQLFHDFFGVKREGAGYRVLRSKYPDIPSSVAVALSHSIYAQYQKEKKDVFLGKRSVRSYRENMPIPVHANNVKFVRSEEGFSNMVWSAGVKEKYTFGIMFGRDKGGYSKTVTDIIDNGKKYGNIQLQKKKNKWYCLLPVHDEEKSTALDESIVVGVDLGIAIPAVCAVSNSPERLYIGNVDDYLRIRTAMQERKRRLQKDLKMVGGGKSRKDKLQALERYDEAETNFKHTYNHNLSRRVVDFAIKNRAGTIHLEDLSGIGESISGKLLRNWSYFEVKTMIENKAKAAGIKVVLIDPRNTSRTCSKCGHVDKENRKTQSKFVCLECGHESNADYNAAVNIART